MPQIIVTASAPQAARVSHAVGRRFSLDHDATIPEVTQIVRDWLTTITLEEEQKEAVATPLGLT